MNKVALPYLTLGIEALDSNVWEVQNQSGDYVPLSNYLIDWDYQQTLFVRKSLIIHKEIASMQLGVDQKLLDLKLCVRVGTGMGSMPRLWVLTKVFEASDDYNFKINLTIPGRLLSGRATFEISVLCDRAPEDSDVLAPSFNGSRVWSDNFDVILEGTEPRFPIETVSFKKTFAANKNINSSLWYLHWSLSTLSWDFGSAVRLYINSDYSEFVDRMSEGDHLTLQFLMAGVMTQMLTAIFNSSYVDTLGEPHEETSVIGYLNRWISMAFPNESIETVRSMVKSRPGDFNAAIMSAAKMDV